MLKNQYLKFGGMNMFMVKKSVGWLIVRMIEMHHMGWFQIWSADFFFASFI